MANTSCRVYYGVAAGEVPFVWESRPGTPKNPISTTTLPPLTPPPSYLFSTNQSHKKKKHRKYSNPLMFVITKLSMMKSQVFSTSSSSHLPSSRSLSSSSSSRNWSCPPSPRMKHGFSSEEEDQSVESPPSTLCFELGRNLSGGFQRYYLKAMHKKNELLQIVGHGSR